MTLPDPDFWRGRRVLVTGATGFKGAWLSLWLARMGAVVTGYAMPEEPHGIYGAAKVSGRITAVTADIRHASVLRQCLHLMRPDVVFHLAGAGPHTEASETYEINTLGTARVLEELRRARNVRSAVIATADAVYEDTGAHTYDEDDRLGARSIYGASKTAAELAVSAFRDTLGPDHRLKVATVRTGCVIGGGDWAANRLVPDAMRALLDGAPLRLRTPEAQGHWIYVLDALAGYLLLAERLHSEPQGPSAWNIGTDQPIGVGALADILVNAWNADDWRDPSRGWEPAPAQGGEAPPAIGLDCAKAQRRLNWIANFSLDQAAAAAVAWHAAQHQGEDMRAFSEQLLDDYLSA